MSELAISALMSARGNLSKGFSIFTTYVPKYAVLFQKY